MTPMECYRRARVGEKPLATFCRLTAEMSTLRALGSSAVIGVRGRPPRRLEAKVDSRDRIVALVAKHFCVSIENLLSGEPFPVIKARRILIYLLASVAGMKRHEIADFLGCPRPAIGTGMWFAKNRHGETLTAIRDEIGERS